MLLTYVLESFAPSLTLLSPPPPAHLLFIPRGQTAERRRRPPHVFSWTCVNFFNRAVTRADLCISAGSDSWRLFGSTGLNIYSHMRAVKSKEAEERKSIAQLQAWQVLQISILTILQLQYCNKVLTTSHFFIFCFLCFPWAIFLYFI